MNSDFHKRYILALLSLISCCVCGNANDLEGSAPDTVIKSAEELFKEGEAYYQRKVYDTAFTRFGEAAQQGHAQAQYRYGNCLQQGKGTTSDPKQALAWYQKAAEQGLVEAQYKTALCLEAGTGAEKDTAQALQWYKKAATT